MAAIELGLDLQRDMVREHRLLTACLGSLNNPAAPSQVTRALKDTGRQTLIRGSGTLNGMFLGTPLMRVGWGLMLTSLPLCLFASTLGLPFRLRLNRNPDPDGNGSCTTQEHTRVPP